MATIAQNLQTLVANKAAIKSAIEAKVNSTITTDMSQWAGIIGGISQGGRNYHHPHCDDKGVWHKPADWPDIESIEIGAEEHTVYLLYGNHLFEHAFISISAGNSGGTMTIEKGTIVNGAFVASSTVATRTSSGTLNYYEWLYGSQDDYTIFKVTSTSGMTALITNAINDSGLNYTKNCNACLMRYGQMKYGTNPAFNCYFIESDNIYNFGEKRGNMNQSFANAYQYNYNMCRWRHTGWNLAKIHITSLAYFFHYCLSLTDIDPDFSGWVTSTCTNLASAFAASNVLYLNLSDWNTTNVTTIASIFNNCTNLTKIDGVEDWELPKATAINNAFYYTKSLAENLDLSGWGITNLCTTATALFQNSGVADVSFSGWDFSGMTTMANMLNGCNNLGEIDFTDITPPSSACKTFQQIFYNSAGRGGLVLSGWDFSGVTTNVGLYCFLYMNTFDEFKFVNCTFPRSTLTSQNNSYFVYQYITYLKKVDLTGLSMSLFTGTQGTYLCHNANMLIDFYPPANINKAFSISAANLLSHDSIIRIFNNLANVTGTVKLTMGSVNMSKVSASEIAIATAKGWTVSAS